jgi:L-amino acid N-acyltransferase YncA
VVAVYVDRVSRSIWQRDLTTWRSVAGADATLQAAPTRRPTAADIDLLAELMLDAYLDTIDYDGETISEARTEVGSWFDNPNARLEWSIVALDGDSAIGAVLAGEFGATAFVHYIMVRSTSKGRGLATLLLASVLDEMRSDGRTTCRAAITDGNTPSERLFASAGFQLTHSITGDTSPN